MNAGAVNATLAFLLWGLFPLYFHALAEVPPLEMLAYRIVWSLLFLGIVLTLRGQWKWLPRVLRQPKVVTMFAASALLLTANWAIYIWAVNNGHVLDTSLGYFITPLLTVMLGMLVLKERLRRGQWLALGLAAAGVVWLAWQAGQLPWIALLLAITFGSYGLLRKTAALAALEGLSFETMLLFPLAAGYLLWLGAHGTATFLTTPSDTTRLLLVAAGPITAIPLLLFASGARKIPMALLGMLQYIAPTIQMILGLVVFHETFSAARLAGFIVIWCAVGLFVAEGFWAGRRTAAAG